MAQINKCGKPDCNPIVQVRGEMGARDYVLFGGTGNAQADADQENYHKYVEMDESIRSDVRIACTTCGTVTPWNKRDAPGMPDAGLDWQIKRWNERN